jgi:DNA-binding NarL/FixJ family response regulator
MISIAIACNNPGERKKIIDLLSTHDDFLVVAAGKDGFDALQAVTNYSPSVIIMDLRLADMNAAELAPLLKRKSPATALMVLGSMDQNHVAGNVISSGIAAYLLKQEDMNKLDMCVRLVCSGGAYVSTPILNRVFASVSILKYFPGQAGGNFVCGCHSESLSFNCSERGIIKLLTRGLDVDEIAKDLKLHQGTVRNCLTAIKRKIGAKNRIQIALYALIHGLISFESLRNIFTPV